MSEVRAFALPDVGEGLTEAEILRWHVRPGDVVKVNQLIVEIETAKASVELPCPFAGTVAELLVDEGSIVPVGSPIITVETPDAPPTSERQAVLVGYGVREGAAEPRRRRRTGEKAAAPEMANGPVRAKPPVRKLARDLGVDLATVTPTGAQGEVTRADVMGAGSGSQRQQRCPCPGHRRRPRPEWRRRRSCRASASRSAASTGPWRTPWCSRRSRRRTSPSGSTST